MEPVTDLIPHRPPFLFVDRIVSETADGLVAERTFRAEEDFYKGHYPGAPITPGVLLCEAVFQTGALFLSRQARAAGGKPGAGVPLTPAFVPFRWNTRRLMDTRFLGSPKRARCSQLGK